MMRKIVALLMIALFAGSSVALAASHAGGKMDDKKMDAKDDAKKDDAKKDEKKADKK
jgi:Ni/Co efflux regulator RcnB